MIIVAGAIVQRQGSVVAMGDGACSGTNGLCSGRLILPEATIHTAGHPLSSSTTMANGSTLFAHCATCVGQGHEPHALGSGHSLRKASTVVSVSEFEFVLPGRACQFFVITALVDRWSL